MTDSLIEKLNNDKPGRAEIFDILGKPEMEGWIRDSSVHYLLKFFYFKKNKNGKIKIVNLPEYAYMND